MRQNSLRTSMPATSESGSNGRKSNSKPPIPPKPLINNRLQPLNSKQELVNIPSNGVIASEYYPTRYAAYPTAVFIKDENIPYARDYTYDYNDYNNPLESVTPLLPVPYTEDKYSNSYSSKSHAINNVLPPLTKAEIIPPSYILTPISSSMTAQDLRNTQKSSNRTISSSAKNALLMEKISGNSFHSHSSKEILPNCSLYPDSSSPNVTVNRSCIISVNNINHNLSNGNIYHPNNNIYFPNGNEIRYIQTQEKQSFNRSDYNVKPAVHNGEVGIKSYPVVASSSLAKDNYMFSEVTSLENYLCFKCNYYLAECKCSKESSNDSYSVYIVANDVTKGRPIADSERHTKTKEKGPNNLPKSKYHTADTKSSSKTEKDEVDCTVDKINIILHNGPSHNLSSLSAPCSPATKPHLRKSSAIDMEEYDSNSSKKLSRGISRATDNVNIVSKARSEIAQGIWEALESGSSFKNSPFFIETPVFTFTLPDLKIYSDEFRQFLEKDLIEMSTLISLEGAGRLNWWAIIGASQRLWPLATSGDGNCLLHAASLGMWGFHDRLLTLRKALHEFLTRSRYCQPLWRRWRWQLALQNKETGLVLSQNEWEEEWESVLRLASSAPRAGTLPQENTTGSAPNLSNTSNSLSQGKLNSDISGPVYESLEEIHVLALAHVLRRPIIVVADTTLKDMNGDPLAPIPFGGIYLPLECPPSECQRSPLLLTYDAAHFSALVIMESNDKNDQNKVPLPAVIPVTDCLHELLPIQFLIDPGESFVWSGDDPEVSTLKFNYTEEDKKNLLNDYLDLIQVPISPTYLEASSNALGSDDLSPHDLTDPFADTDKKSSESSFDSDEGPPLSENGMNLKSKAPKQLHTVVRSFGSIGRSMSKRIKKNLSKLGRTGSFRRKLSPVLSPKGEYIYGKSSNSVKVGTQQNFILAATIHTEKRQAYQQEMIENYLATARERFIRESSSSSTYKGSKSPDISNNGSTNINGDICSSNLIPSAVDNITTNVPIGFEKGMVQCINSGCNHYGTSQTSYMCASCFDRQKEEEEKEYNRQISGSESKVTVTQNTEQYNRIVGSDRDKETLKGPPYSPPLTLQLVRCNGVQYGAGKSRFYAQLDETSVRNATLIPVVQTKSGAKDKTIFLSNSTFYNDGVSTTIPSYNLNKDIRRESKKGKSNGRNDSHHSSSSSFNESVSMIRVSPTFAKDSSLAPICIDDVRLNLKKSEIGNSNNNISNSLQKLNAALVKETTMVPVALVDSKGLGRKPKTCLTKGCNFFGSSATDYLCSKCHFKKKKNNASSSQ